MDIIKQIAMGYLVIITTICFMLALANFVFPVIKENFPVISYDNLSKLYGVMPNKAYILINACMIIDLLIVASVVTGNSATFTAIVLTAIISFYSPMIYYAGKREEEHRHGRAR